MENNIKSQLMIINLLYFLTFKQDMFSDFFLEDIETTYYFYHYYGYTSFS